MAKKPRRAKPGKQTKKIAMRRLWRVTMTRGYRDPTSASDDAKNATWKQQVAAPHVWGAIEAAQYSACRQAIEAEPNQPVSPDDFFVVTVRSLGAFDSDALED